MVEILEAPSALEQALARSGGSCERCRRGLHGRYHIHHKDMNPHNNELSNLLVLCPNCHYMVEGPHPEEILSFYQ
jgi:predicted HNH restriction endonuclease